MKYDQDLNLQYDFGKMNSTLGSVVPLAMFYSSVKSMARSVGIVGLTKSIVKGSMSEIVAASILAFSV